jgi:hypothetical protein
VKRNWNLSFVSSAVDLNLPSALATVWGISSRLIQVTSVPISAPLMDDHSGRLEAHNCAKPNLFPSERLFLRFVPFDTFKLARQVVGPLRDC